MRSALFALALIAAPAIAQLPGAPDVTRVAPGTYQVDSDHTQLLFTVGHFGFSEYTAQFTQPTGSVTLDPANAANDKVDIIFPIDKVSTTTPKLDAHLKSADFFDAAKFPEAHFVSTKVTITGKTATIAGNLTLKGITKPVTLAVRFVGAGANPMSKKTNIGFTATTSVKRSDFGITFLLPVVSDDVKLTINAAFVSQ